MTLPRRSPRRSLPATSRTDWGGGVMPTVIRSAACLYTVASDAGFILDVLPEHPNVIAASACSGHGFKHSGASGASDGERRWAVKNSRLNGWSVLKLEPRYSRLL